MTDPSRIGDSDNLCYLYAPKFTAQRKCGRDLVTKGVVCMAPPKNAPRPKGNWQPGDRLKHATHGTGIVTKVIRHSNKTWLEVKFGSDFLQIAPNDPAIERI